MNLDIENGTIVTFHTQRVGKKDLKKDGGVHRGRHHVKVTMLVGTDYKTVAGIDFMKLYEKDPNDYYEKFKSMDIVEDLDQLGFSCAWHSRSLYEGLYESSRGENTYNKHFDVYDPHPCGVRGVLVHKETGGIYIMGVLINEEIVEEDPNGDARKSTYSKERKIVRAIQKEFGLVSGKWRSYKLPAGTTINGLSAE